MAKIISSRKKYVPVKDLKVYPSNKETIEVIPDDCNGAHRYRAQMCAGFVNGKTKYVDATDTISVCPQARRRYSNSRVAIRTTCPYPA